MPATTAWGLEFGGSTIRLVRVSLSDARYSLDASYACQIIGRWDQGLDYTAGVDELRAKVREPMSRDQPLVVCIPDQVTVYRMLDLPASDEAAMRRMVEAQMEVLLPGRSQMFTWDVRRQEAGDGEEGRVWLCAARKDVVEAAVAAAGRLGLGVERVMPSAMAVAAGFSRLLDAPKGRVALVDIGARSTTVTLLADGQARACSVLDESIDHWMEQAAEQLGDSPQQLADSFRMGRADARHHAAVRPIIEDWAMRLRELWDEQTQALSRADRPGRCLIIGGGRNWKDVVDALSGQLGLAVEPATTPAAHWADEAATLSACRAAAGALTAMGDEDETVNLARSPQSEKPGRPWLTFGRVAAVIWLAAAIVGLYATDVLRARSLSHSAAEVDPGTAERLQLDRQLALSRYLRGFGPPPLTVLDEIATLTAREFVIEQWSYNRAGEVRLTGIAPNEAELRKYLDALAKTKSIDHVQISNHQAIDKGKVKFDLTIELSDWLGPTPPESEATPEPEAEKLDPAKPADPQPHVEAAPEADGSSKDVAEATAPDAGSTPPADKSPAAAPEPVPSAETVAAATHDDNEKKKKEAREKRERSGRITSVVREEAAQEQPAAQGEREY